MADGAAFLDIAKLFVSLESTTKRKEKKKIIIHFFQKLAKEDIRPAISFLAGRVFPEADNRVLDVGGKIISDVSREHRQSILVPNPLTISTVRNTFNEIAQTKGEGSRTKKRNLVQGLLSQATPLERKYLIRLLLGEMRIGVVEGITLEAIADAASVELSTVRRAYMLLGNLAEVAYVALTQGIPGLNEVKLCLFTPIKPMLAEMSYSLEEVLDTRGGLTAFEHKFDGARVQIHREGTKLKIYSRRLTDVTDSIPEIAELVWEKIKVKSALLDGEVVAYGDQGKPLPFQDLMRRFRRVHNIDEMRKKVPLKFFAFDILFCDGESLIDTPYQKRWKILTTICDSEIITQRIITNNVCEAKAFLESAVELGHEGIMAKALNSQYTPGVRGKQWFKIKPTETLDLVITAADWGYGRRSGWLSNYHLAVRDPNTGELLPVGKTFKGLTDQEFREITSRLQRLKVDENRFTVYVKPQIIVEVAFNEIQRSPHYASGFALRFARITKIRQDKEIRDIDTLERLQLLYEKQFQFKSKLQS